MNYIPATEFCTQEQITNLHKLLDFLKSGKAKTRFNMSVYSSTYTLLELIKSKFIHVVPKSKQFSSRIAKTSSCFTVCCLAGHGHLAGVDLLEGETWGYYVARVFTKNRYVYSFLFQPAWVDYQPTKEQATFRLELFLKKGLPDGFIQPVTGMQLITNTRLSNFRDQCKLGVHTLA